MTHIFKSTQVQDTHLLQLEEQLTSSLSTMDSVALHKDISKIFTSLVESNPVKLKMSLDAFTK